MKIVKMERERAVGDDRDGRVHGYLVDAQYETLIAGLEERKLVIRFEARPDVTGSKWLG